MWTYRLDKEREEFFSMITVARDYQEHRAPGRTRHYWGTVLDNFSTYSWKDVVAELESLYYSLEPEYQTRYYDLFLKNTGGVLLYTWLEHYKRENKKGKK